jgi:hypothetical protein
MTMTEAQPLNIATASKLTEACEFLREAAILVTDVKAILGARGYVATVDRMKEIEGRLVREMLAMERLIEASTPGLCH